MKPADLERVRAYVDGELDADASTALVRDAQADAALGAELDAQRALRSLLRALPPMVAPLPQPRSWWARFWEGRRISLRPAAAMAAAAGLVAMGALGERALRLGDAAVQVAVAPVEGAGQVPVRFVFVGHAQQVAVAGTFNHWNATASPLTSTADGVFETTVLVPRGEHRYQFRVDGEWMPDPLSERQAPDGMGHIDSVFQL